VDVTDDATLVERNGGIVVIVDGDRANIKITFPGDLAMAEAILAGGLS
jgi:2-C-methyl-D-erythritol 4-phosphate cytidylyltransferase